MDEAAYIDPDLFFKVIVPILSMRMTSLILLSSPEGEGNYFSNLTTMKKEDGSDFFQLVDCFRICSKCMKLERVKAMACPHIKTTPHWLSSKKIAELKTLYKANPEDALREFGGMSISNHKPALLKDEVQRLFKRVPYASPTNPSIIFTACDPNGGGPSQMSLGSGYFNVNGHLVVSGHIQHKRLLDKVFNALNNIMFRNGMMHNLFHHIGQALDKGVKVQTTFSTPHIAGFVHGSAIALYILISCQYHEKRPEPHFAIGVRALMICNSILKHSRMFQRCGIFDFNGLQEQFQSFFHALSIALYKERIEKVGFTVQLI